jgi:excisionase family DNA binding protein
MSRLRGIDHCLTVREVAAILGYSEKHVQRMCRMGTIRTVRSSPRAQNRIPLSALRDFFERDQSYWAFRAEFETEQNLAQTLLPDQGTKPDEPET